MILNDVSEYVYRDLKPPMFFIEDILPQGGVLLLFGGPKVMKSWMSQQMGYAIATGKEWMGFISRQGKVIMFQFEISPIAYWLRLKLQYQHYPELKRGCGQYFEHSQLGMDLGNDEDFKHIAAHLIDTKPDVIFLDCLAACFKGDENSSKDMSDFIERINMLRNICGSAVVLVHHSRKMPALSSFAETARGAGRLAGWVDTLACLTSISSNKKQLQFMARQAVRELPPLDVTFQNHLFVRA